MGMELGEVGGGIKLELGAGTFDSGVVGGGIFGWVNGAEDEVDDGVSEEGNDKAEQGIKNGVFGVGDFFVVAAGKNIA